jgi:hypothetical protein
MAGPLAYLNTCLHGKRRIGPFRHSSLSNCGATPSGGIAKQAQKSFNKKRTKA